jgi:Tfp pilus assembly protein PilN
MTYSNSLTLSRGQYSARAQFSSRQQNTVNLRSAARRLGPVSNTVILLVLACLLGLLYLTQVTKTNAYGYQINSLKDKQTALQSQNSDLQVASARLQSLERTKHSQVAANLKPITPSGTVTN